MRKSLYFFIVSLLALPLLTGCTDNCRQTRTYRKFVPVQIPLADLRKPVTSGPAQAVIEPGKLYVKDQYLFIVETKKGIHVFDNSNPASPRAVSFLTIPGNVDLAVRDNILYADSYIDLVAIDISNPASVREVGRAETGFKNGQIGRTSWNYDSLNRKLNDTREEIAIETVQTDCEGTFNILPYLYAVSWFGRGYLANDFASFQSSSTKTSSGAPTVGSGGSMARFALMNDQLYVVNNYAMQLFDLARPNQPRRTKTINLGWNVETIFPYRQNLFIGTTTGMYIFDASTPAEPKQVAAFPHARSCDPVVVHDNYAYVTLRGATSCGSWNQQDVLDIVNIADPTRPQLVKSYPLETPYGLGIDFPTLFVCQGNKGLSVFDISNPTNPEPRQTFPNAHAFDVIPLAKVLLMVGKDGLYQYDYSNPANLRLLSRIAVQQPI